MNKMVPQIEIIAFSDAYREIFKKLNYDWIERYFRIEKGDELSLSNPETEILGKGGFIFFAKIGGEVLGTVALLKKSDTVFELSKMAVGDSAQGKGVGNELIAHCVSFASELNIEKLVLYSNTSLKPAIHLYKKFGFQEIELEDGVYDRADIKMEKIL
ncbi:GNAT family N-acetyltransferase [Flavobacterium silvaticum]|uniref:GNAT family N-acetyltransferase n=1 Tax=Flavobacterium silvaticum TaxID=1852020 RepID=A0A972FTI7_9FLAO|nr:GNAT family N-acetyltransferase [Flavobacterium silvaticum]NMH27290.1 GNAT family N-acetyltransferase [Flavobacterium silvaticum]